MIHYRNLTIEQVRGLPWVTVTGMLALELAQAKNLAGYGRIPDTQSCLDRARDLMGILEIMSGIPVEAALELAPVGRALVPGRIEPGAEPCNALYDRLMKIYLSYDPSGRPV